MDDASVSLKVEVAAQAGEALAKLADTIGKVTAAEARMTAETKRLQQASERLESQKKEFERERRRQADLEKARGSFGSAVGSVSRGARSLAGGGLTSLGSFMGGPAAVVAAGVQAADAAMSKFANAQNIINNGMLSKAQKQDALLGEFVPLYDSFRRLREAMDGTTERIAASGRQLQIRMGVGAATGEAFSKSRAAGYEYQQAEAAYGAWNVVGAPGAVNTFDRGTATGARAYQEQQTAQGALDARTRAQRALVAAQTSMRSQQAQYGDAIGRADATEKKYFTERFHAGNLIKEENRTGVRDKASIRESLDRAEVKGADATRAIAQAEQELLRLRQEQVKAIEAASNARKADIEVAKASLAIEEQREQRMAGLAQKLGSMNQADYEFAKQQLQAVKEFGIENLPQEMADAASAVAPEYIAKQREQLGAKRAREAAGEFGGIDDSTLDDYRKNTLEEVRATVDKVRADIRVQINLDEKLLNEDLVNQLAPVLKMIQDLNDRKIDLVRSEIIRGQISAAQSSK